jgi:hypothetical protein
MGLLIGLGDYYAEIRIMEEELGMPESERFNLKAALHNRCKNLWILVEDFNVEEPVVEIDVDW